MIKKPARAAESPRVAIAKIIVSLGLGLLALWIASGFLPALAWAGIIAIAIDPLYLRALNTPFLNRHRNTLAILICLLIALFLIVPLIFGITRGAREVSAIVTWLAQAQISGVPVPDWAGQLPFAHDAVTQWWRANLATPQGAQALLHQFNTGNWVEHSRMIGANVLRRLVILAFTLITLFFLLRNRESVIAQCRVAGEKLLGSTSERILRQTVLSVRSTIDGLVLVGLGEGAIMTVVYVFVGVPHPLIMGVLTAVAAIFPFGAAVMLAIATGLLLVQNAVSGAIAVVVAGLIVVGGADHTIRPAMIGGAIKLPFLWVLIGILGGVEGLGLLGLFIGPATMAVLFMLWRDFVDLPGSDITAPEPS